MCKQIDYGGNMEIVKDIKREIFKAYDIRGKYPEQIDKNIAYTIGKSYGTMLLNKNKNTCKIKDRSKKHERLYTCIGQENET